MPADLVARLLLNNKEFDRKIEESRKQVKTLEKRMNMAAASVKSFVGGFAGMAGVSFALMDVVQRSMKFEKSLSSLKALTGATAKEIEYYKQEAIKLGSTSTQTASQVVEAFQLIGSQNPELLKSKESLSEMTKQAIILAEAAGMDVPEAARALSGSINQMGESTDKAGEYINILAAASQNGSADIQYLSKAIEKSGGAASSVGVEYNELVAAIEAIAPKITDASQAGTNLRNIFLTLESSSDKKLKPSVVGLTEAIKNLSAMNMDATQMTKMFGKENVTAALAIVKAKDDYLKYVEAITGTNTALEQQKINNDNLSGAVNNLSSAWEGLILTINQSNGILKDTLNLLASGISKVTSLFEGYQQRENKIIAEGVKNRKSELEKDLKTWESYGFSRKEAIEKVRESVQGYYNSSEDIEGLKEEERKLNELTKKYESLKQESNLKINPVKIAMRQNIVGNAIVNSGKADKLLNRADVNINPNLEAELVNLKRKIEAQRELVTQKRLENELYSQSVQYLDRQASRLEKINNTDKPTSGVADLKEEDLKLKATWNFEDQTKSLDSFAKKEIQKIKDEMKDGYELPIPLRLIYMPEDKMEEELPDVKGSISDYQKQIQDLTIIYNEETNEALRSIYAKRIEDMESTLKKMTDVNKGMIDLSGEVQNLIQNSLTSGFESFGEAIASSDPTASFRNMLSGMMDMLKQFGAALVAAGAAKLAFDKLLWNPVAAIIAGGSLIVAVTAAKAALQKAAKPMAEGGIVYGETFARVGEYAGANTNPEVVAPLNKLRDLIIPEKNEPVLKGDVVFKLRGTELVGVLDNYNRKQGRTR